MIIDWDNLPICGKPPIIVISPYICIDDGYTPPVDPPHGTVPLPGTLMLLGIGLLAMRLLRRRS